MSEEEIEALELEPVSGDLDVQRVPCYPPLLQRIVNRDFMTETQSVFDVVIPLSELVEWNDVRGGELAERATANTLRYQKLFSEALDQILKGMEPTHTTTTTHATSLRDTLEIWQQHRQAAQERTRLQQQQQPQQQNDNAGVDGEAQPQNRNRNQGITQDFPPELLRRFELRILPLGRRTAIFPFDRQYHHSGKASTPPPTAVSLRQVRSPSLGQLVTLSGMIVKATDVKPVCVVATYTCDA